MQSPKWEWVGVLNLQSWSRHDHQIISSLHTFVTIQETTGHIHPYDIGVLYQMLGFMLVYAISLDLVSDVIVHRIHLSCNGNISNLCLTMYP